MIWLLATRGLIRSVSVEAELLEDRRARRPGLGLARRVDLEQTEVPLHHLHARLDGVALSATSVSRLISMPGEISTYSDRLAGERQEAPGHGPQIGGVLGLQAVQERVSPQVDVLLIRYLPTRR